MFLVVEESVQVMHADLALVVTNFTHNGDIDPGHVTSILGMTSLTMVTSILGMTSLTMVTSILGMTSFTMVTSILGMLT